ncbi:MAG: hypothetical protein ACJ764_12755 [Solirubrobacteraceae bacterium]
MRWPWQKKENAPEDESASSRQQWSRRPTGLDAITGAPARVEQAEDANPGVVYPDEIDPEWADRPQEAVDEPERPDSSADSPA